jgi:glycosyltransferase involved in cell wall biosynthesis
MRMWDIRTAHGPDAIIANSAFIARRIRKVYGRVAEVIYPPVTLSQHNGELARGRHFLAASRLVPYKNIEAVVRAFRLLPDLELTVAGDGPEARKLRDLATANVTFTGFVKDEVLRQLMATARAFIFASEEDFGIVPVEAQSEGTPVLALGRGGVRESIATFPHRTGLFFSESNAEQIAACVRSFVAQEHLFSRSTCRAQANRFSADRFRAQFKAYVEMEFERNRLPNAEGTLQLLPSRNYARSRSYDR